jgi:hypothetical protein
MIGEIPVERKQSEQTPPEPKGTLLVVGDWMIDDYWIAGSHESRTASRVGRTHYRALNRPDSNVQSLGGAGRVASILSEAGYSLYGLGMWHPEDTTHLAAMLNRTNVTGWTPCRITRSPRNPPDDVTLASLAVPHARYKNPTATTLGDQYQEYGTARVLRLNQSKGDTPQLLGRLDWDALPTSWENNDRVWIGPSDVDGIKDAIKTTLIGESLLPRENGELLGVFRTGQPLKSGVVV